MPGTAANRLRIDADSNLARLVKEASATGKLLLLDTGEAEYAVRVEDRTSAASRSGAGEGKKEPIWADYNPEAALQNFEEVEGSWSDLDADKLIADIYRWREGGSRPANRP